MKFRALHDFMFGTLRGRLIFSVASIHAIMMSLFIVDLTVRQRAVILEHQEESATTLAQSLSTTAAGWLAAHDLAGLQELVNAQRGQPELVFAMFTDKSGRILAHTERIRVGQMVLDLPRAPRLRVIGKSADLVDVAAPAMIGGRLVGWARIGVAQKIAGQKLAEITNSGLWYALGAILAGSVIAWMMGRRITRSLYVVQDTINAVKAGNRSVRSKVVGTDEAARLAGEFNAMLDTLSERDAERDRAQIVSSQMAAIVEYSDSAIMSCNLEGTLLTWNAAAERLFGYTRTEMLGASILRLVPAELHAEERQILEKIGRGDSVRHFETIRQTRDGRQIDVSVTASPIKDASGRVVGVSKLSHDIAERKKAEAVIRRRSEELQARIEELARFNSAAVNRELIMVKLKKQINDLSRRLGQEPPYPLDFLQLETAPATRHDHE